MSRIFTVSVASVYPHYVNKVEKKGRTKEELDQVIRWLTGFDEAELRSHLEDGTTFEDFFADARLNPNASLITGVVCGKRVETIEDPLMQKIRYLDKLVDELAKGRPMDKILRGGPSMAQPVPLRSLTNPAAARPRRTLSSSAASYSPASGRPSPAGP